MICVSYDVNKYEAPHVDWKKKNLPVSVKVLGDNISAYHHHSYVWTPQQMCRKCSEDSLSGCSRDVPLMEKKKNADCLSSSSVLLSSVSTFSENPMFNIVYKRKNQRASPEDMERMDNCPSVAEKDHVDPINIRTESETVNGCMVREEHCSGEQQHKIIDIDSVNDSCSSKSVPLIPEVDETGECSSSSVIIGIEGSDDVPLSGGLLEKAVPPSLSNTSSTSCPCKACGRADKATTMLICDHCDEGFHLNCCNPRVKEVEEDDDWFCGSCLKEKHILVKQRSSLSRRSARINCETSRSKNDESSLISLMLQDTEPYTTSLRVGKGFQAEVPDWTGPLTM